MNTLTLLGIIAAAVFVIGALLTIVGFWQAEEDFEIKGCGVAIVGMFMMAAGFVFGASLGIIAVIQR